MDFFDKIGENISTTGKAMAKKVNEITEITKLNNKISAAKDTMKESYLELGKVYYELYKDTSENECAEIITRIQKSSQDIETLTVQIQKLKGIITCPDCGAALDNESVFCNKCGCKLPEVQTDTDETDSFVVSPEDVIIVPEVKKEETDINTNSETCETAKKPVTEPDNISSEIQNEKENASAE